MPVSTNFSSVLYHHHHPGRRATSMDSSPNLSTSCRILAIGSSLDGAIDFVQQIRTLSGHIIDNGDINDTRKDQAEVNGEKLMPWVISNKYYSAQVHFLARTVKGLAPFHSKEVPALVFIWRKGYAYKHNIERICRDRELNGSAPEVSLAVRIELNDDENGKEDEEEEENFEDTAEIDEYLSSKGFEFIDVPAANKRAGDDEISVDAIPSLPRVLDALSTIMWPTMQSSVKRQNHPRKAMADETSLDWAQISFDEGEGIDPDIDDLVAVQTPAGRVSNQARIRTEMEELRRWLEDDAHEDSRNDKDDPWRHAPSLITSQTGLTTTSPTSEEGGAFDSARPTSYPTSAQGDGFDDDFTVFVSAPTENSAQAPSTYPKSHTSSIGGGVDFPKGEFPTFASFGDSKFVASSMHTELDDEHETMGDTSFDSLAPPGRYAGVLYHSLGSASDLGDIGDEEAHPVDSNDGDTHNVHLDDEKESDDGLPSEREIRDSAQRIFGPLPTAPLNSGREYAEDDNMSDFGDNINFDLTQMVSAIQGMKEEISGIEDEDERRKAAARVALGLVYGLDRQT
ncbi:hypothetical protein D9757_005542 [Collybiopsis confluens]|uniref:Uncharacterized protein n=1 Tax=Collybiopsis confluens TaxID=2823264 RepID=A0A8H5M9G3_9AGAR|nr:hypothetical protein D9757_005542 [Collybiopsis confluens]